MMKRIYLDYAATTPVHEEVIKAMLPFFSHDFGNPSSIYAYGQEAKKAVEAARGNIARLIGAYPEEIIFTSGGTEADNLAIKGIAYSQGDRGNHIITSAIEHHAVLDTCHFLAEKGFQITYLPVDGYGMVDPDEVRKAITRKTVLISIMHANNEIGTIEPIAEIGKIAQESGIPLHTDAVQTAGHIPLKVNELGIDMASISAHKLYGPKGVGVLYVRKGLRLTPLVHGGGQEKGRRSGTENVSGIVGFGKAAEIALKDMPEEASRLTSLRDRFINALLSQIDDCRLNGHPRLRLPNNVNIAVQYVEGESILLSLDAEGICASTGSACSSASLEPSHVLLAIGLSPEQAHGSLRLTLGKWITEDDIEKVLDILPGIVRRLRAMSPLARGTKQGDKIVQR